MTSKATFKHGFIAAQLSGLLFFFSFVIAGNVIAGSGILFGSLAICCSCALYLISIKKNASLVNFEGIFSLSWMTSAGLSLFRLHPSQVAWNWKTIAIVGMAPLLLTFGIELSKRVSLNNIASFLHTDDPNPKRVNAALIAASTIVLVAFGLDLLYSKELPLVSKNQASYMSFGMPMVHYLTVSCCLLPALYFDLFRRGLITPRKDFVASSLVAVCAIIPILIVSRQLLILEVFLFVAVPLSEFKSLKGVRLRYVFLGIAVIVVGWLALSVLRNQSTAYLASVFLLPSTTSSGEMALWQLYLYVAFNFDSLNYLVANLDSFTFGANTLFPVIALLKLKSLFPVELFSTSAYRALPTFTTYTFLLPAYMDFGTLGALLYPFLIGVFSGFVKRMAKTRSSACGRIAELLILYSLVISFFVSEFAQPIFWVYLLLLGIFAFILGELRFRIRSYPSSK